MQDIRIALAQITCPVGQLAQNLEKHRQYTRRAAEAGARLIAFSEASLTGYPAGADVPHELAQPLDGEVCRSLVALSAETKLLILAGLVERDRSGVLYNTVVVAAPHGLVGGYRKAHVSCTEIHRFNEGDEFLTFSWRGTTFGVQICYDMHFAEMTRCLALRGAEVILALYASPDPCTPEGHAAKRSRWLKYLPARAFDNSVFVVAVNQVGSSGPLEYPGNSIVFDPTGEIMAEATPMKEDLLIVDLTAAGLLAKRHEALQFFTQFRRPELYGELLRPSRAPIVPGSDSRTAE
jgi:N-carbamoylputrescine amidase